MKKNLLGSKSVYNAYYGDFRGVDFSSDHTQVHKQRLAYAVNMYKDYQSGQGQGLETIPGFRRRVQIPDSTDSTDSTEIYGIHHFKLDGKDRVLIHAGSKLYLWHNYPLSLGVDHNQTVYVPKEVSSGSTLKKFIIDVDKTVAFIQSVYKLTGEAVTPGTYTLDATAHTLTIESSEINEGDNLYITYLEGKIDVDGFLFDNMNKKRSTSFVFNNKLYLIDGQNYLVYDGNAVKSVSEDAYVPTTYINIIPSGDNRNNGAEYEVRNFLTPKFKHTFYGDGQTKEFYMNENELDGVVEVKVYGTVLSAEEYSVNTAEGKISINNAPQAPADAGKPEDYAGVEITASKTYDVSNIEQITNCTLAATFQDRVFLSGNSDTLYSNRLYFCGRHDGYTDATYFPINNFEQDGVGNAPITAMVAVADTLMVLKSDTQQDGSTYFHTAVETGENLHPVAYKASRGLAGIGCLGACVNFLDDPVFVSRLGLEAVGQLSVRLERAIEHRSSLIDAKLVNLDLSNATLEEWNGYLILLVDGKIFMADSRQRYTHAIGVMQYEWYYLEDIGIFDGQYDEYRYSKKLYYEGVEVDYNGEKIPLVLANDDKIGEAANGQYGDSSVIHSQDVTVNVGTKEEPIYDTVNISFSVHQTDNGEREAWVCETKGNKTGGDFKPAVIVKTIGGNLFFGTENGIVCSFNFDQRNEHGEIAPAYYTFDNRTIYCGCATKMDNCDIPHLTKNTVKKSTVIKTKVLQTSAAKIKVRTNRKPYDQIARINSSIFSFDNIDFSDFSFIPNDQSLFSVREKEKKWVEKQYFVYSDEYMKPFALYYVSYRYTVAGRYKET